MSEDGITMAWHFFIIVRYEEMYRILWRLYVIYYSEEVSRGSVMISHYIGNICLDMNDIGMT